MVNAAQVYQGSKIQTASAADLTLMLYEGAIKFCNLALVGIEKGDVQKAHTNIVKAERIIQELQITLDHKYPVAEDFDRIYTIVNDRLIQANVRKEAEPLEEALGHLRDLRDIWKEIMKIAKSA